MTGDGYPFQIMFFFSTEQIKSINMKFYLEELFEQNQNLLCHVLDCKYLILRWGRRGVQEGPGKHCGERHGEAP